VEDTLKQDAKNDELQKQLTDTEAKYGELEEKFLKMEARYLELVS